VSCIWMTTVHCRLFDSEIQQVMTWKVTNHKDVHKEFNSA
jgi:hypothetical protein